MQQRRTPGKRGGTRDLSADRREAKSKRAVNVREQKDRLAERDKRRLKQRMRTDLKRLAGFKKDLEDLISRQDKKARLDRQVERKLLAVVSQVEEYLQTGKKPDLKALDGALVYVVFLITILTKKIRAG